MDLSKYNLEDIFISAMKSEVDAKEFYSKLKEKLKNPFMQEKLKFLINEEKLHYNFLEKLYNKKFPNKDINLEKKSPVPLPEIKINKEMTKVYELFNIAMDAEKSAQEFYMEFSKLFTNDSEIRVTLEYFSTMELGHYKILEIEKESLKKFESLIGFQI